MSTDETLTTEPAPLGGAAYLRLIGIGAAIGIPAALVAVGFLALVHEIQHVLWTSWPESMGLTAPPWWMVLGLPVAGALLVWGARTLLPGDGGHEPLLGISLAPTAVGALPSVALAAIASLSFGAVLGPEGPLIALGSIVGMIAVRWWKVTGPGAQVLSTAGAFAAVSALFGGPVVAGALLLEAGIGFGSALIPVLLPGAVAAAVGFTIITGIGAWGGVPTGPMQIPDLPAYPTVRIVDMALAIVVGVVVALLIAAARTVARRVSDSRPRLGTGPTLVIGGLVVGLLAQAIVALGGTYDLVLFSGQLALPALLAESSAWLVLAVIAAKVLGFALCLGVGFRGGPVFPAIFIGAGVATLIGMPFGMSATVALAIGIAAGMTSFTRLVFSSLVFTLLLEGTQGLSTAPVAVLAAATAWLVGHALDTRAAGSSP